VRAFQGANSDGVLESAIVFRLMEIVREEPDISQNDLGEWHRKREQRGDISHFLTLNQEFSRIR
jgi:hypothetical protein